MVLHRNEKAFLLSPVYKHLKSMFAYRAPNWRKPAALKQFFSKETYLKNEEINCITNKGKTGKIQWGNADSDFLQVLYSVRNFFVGYQEKDWIEKAQVVKPTFQKRYVDNIFPVFQSKLDAATFYTYLNTKHRSIKYKKQIKNKLPFLDILISNNKNKNKITRSFMLIYFIKD